MMDLIERFVSAVESIAASIKENQPVLLSAERVTPPEPVKVPQSERSTVPVTEEVAPAENAADVDYAGLAQAGKRDVLLGMCEEKNITVPARTRTPTLVKMLTAHDEATSALADNDPFAAKESTAEETSPGDDPFATKEPTDEELLAEPEEKYTLPQVKEHLMKIMGPTGAGKSKVTEILKLAGAAALKDVPEDKFAFIMSQKGE